MGSPALRLASLGRFHYIVAVLMAVLWSLPGIIFWIQWPVMQKDADLIQPWMGPAMAIVGIGMLVDGWIMAALLALAGFFIRRCKHRTYCLVVAGLSIPHAPFASILGVLSLVIFTRPHLRAL